MKAITRSLASGLASTAMTIAFLSGCHPSHPAPPKEAAVSNRLAVAKLEKLKAKAQSSAPETQFNLGLMYARGDGADQDFREAAKWFLKAAERGDTRAQATLGVMFANGEGL